MKEQPYINLQQALKKYNLVATGGEAKMVIQNGEVTVDGQVETRRGRKLHGGEKVAFQGREVVVDNAH